MSIFFFKKKKRLNHEHHIWSVSAVNVPSRASLCGRCLFTLAFPSESITLISKIDVRIDFLQSTNARSWKPKTSRLLVECVQNVTRRNLDFNRNSCWLAGRAKKKKSDRFALVLSSFHLKCDRNLILSCASLLSIWERDRPVSFLGLKQICIDVNKMEVTSRRGTKRNRMSALPTYGDPIPHNITYEPDKGGSLKRTLT